jgi:isoleucyl-tRNA synthetase
MAEERKTIDEKEKEILDFWEKDKTFEKSLKKTQKSNEYIFYDGPPFATGLPHYGHILASVLKDAIPRFWTMQGKHVRRVWGWDCHGLPVETIAEKELKINSKDEIEKMGVDKFNAFCRSKVLTYANEWGKTVKRIARWVDFKNSYKTMDNNYIESVWWAFKQLFEKGYLYEGEKILMFCPRCSTPLAKSEIAMDNSYRTVKDDTITVKFKLLDKLKEKDVFALSWTTTPWTLPSNLALTVNTNLKYVYLKDKTDGTIYLLGKGVISKYFKSESDYEILKEVYGRELEGKKYEPLFPYFSDFQDSFRFILGDFVNEEDGTGIVHTAPAFGEDDYNVCQKNNIAFCNPVDEKGKFLEEVKDFAGEFIFDSNKKIIEFLKKQGKIVKVERKEHEYPFCYRCETPLMYRALPAWFVNIDKIRAKLLKLNKKINWYPGFLKDGRFKYNLETAPNWNITRNRYWASAIPVWKCSSCKKIKVIGSIKELKENALNLKEEIDLHKDYLDKVKLKCDCGKEMIRIPEVMDCWFESGSMPFAQFHYPFENKKFFEENFPAQFVVEYIGQTRAWFYYMLVLSAILFDEIPFENVLTTGTILAEDGEKMSKSKGNFPNPELIFQKYGVDALRFYLLSTPIMNADNLNFSEKGVEEIYKKVMVLLYNVSNFYTLYGDIKEKKTQSKEIIDLWIISKTNELIKDAEESLKSYDTIKACSSIRSFVDDLSTWYVRRNRDRFNEGDSDAKTTLKYALENLSKVIAPIMPFIAEIIYKNLSNKESVHLQEWPKFDNKINKKINEDMQLTREMVSLALKERDVAKISLKQPLAKLTISGVKLSENFISLIKEEVNVKEVQIKSGGKISVELDTKLTPELEAEGYARELARFIQNERKKVGLVKEDEIEIEIDSELNKIFRENKEFLQERINAKKIHFSKTGKTFSYSTEGKIKNFLFRIGFDRISW